MNFRANTRRYRLKVRRQKLWLPFGAQRFLALLEGIEGGFAIAASIVVGLSFAGLSNRTLLISALISTLVNGFNASAVKYSSEHYEDELDGRERSSAFKAYFIPAAIEFVSYFLIGLLALTPLFLLPANYVSVLLYVAVTLLMLFVAGYWRGYLMRLHPVRDGIEMMLLGAAIIVIGGLTGYVIHLL